MESDRWQRVEALYHAASALPEGERTAYLRDVCGADEQLVQEVESLLDADRGLSFLDRPAEVLDITGALAARPDGIVGRVGNYYLLARLGGGSVGEVYHAIDTKRHREVAVRLLPEAFVVDPQHLWQLQRDARVLARLNHPHIGAILGLKMVEPRQHALIVEMIEGDTLATRLSTAPVPPSIALDYGRQILSALAAVHSQRVAHGRLRPSNVLLKSDSLCKVVDFGIGPAERLPVDDVRDFARLLVAMFGGTPAPGQAGASEQQAWSALRANTRPGTVDLIERCLDPAPERRPTAAALLLQLEEQRPR
jgi:eukaryotic-like serine/threonine-protein kinase